MPRDLAKPTRRAHFTRDTAQHAMDTLATLLDNTDIDARQQVDIATKVITLYYDYLKQIDGKHSKDKPLKLPKNLEFKSAYTITVDAPPELTDNSNATTAPNNAVSLGAGGTTATAEGVGGAI